MKAWHAFLNLLRAAARDPLWALMSVVLSPFRMGKYLFILALFTAGGWSLLVLLWEIAGRSIGLPKGGAADIAGVIAINVLIAAVAWRLLTTPLICHFGDGSADTHGSARFSTRSETNQLILIHGPADQPRSQVRQAAALRRSFPPADDGADPHRQGCRHDHPEPAGYRPIHRLYRSQGRERPHRWPCAPPVRTSPRAGSLWRHRHPVGFFQPAGRTGSGQSGPGRGNGRPGRCAGVRCARRRR